MKWSGGKNNMFYDWLASKIADWLYDILIHHIERKFKRRHKESTWLHLARRISERYKDDDYNI